jgi:hypothetical protein
MLINPDAGWVQIRIGEFEERASYLTDVPIDILEAFIELYKHHKPVAIKFDAEGWEYIIVIDHYQTHIIDYTYRTDDEYLNSEDEKQVLITVEINKNDLAKEFISDIERDYDKWVRWMYYDEKDTIAERKEYLDTKLQELKSFVFKN